ncbi:hypothetical protein Taro_001972 [Colocasia esculenta]|uniref:Aminotransferase-like plant mobile domain-containing protein n=1 Tax=Colocasia esculenta TaxID=4460 RepID=A0A843THH2_COLES|nr:hypothetical protein [Colocasia esculenta]
MGFGPFLRLEELTSDVALIQALKERWDPGCHAFLFPWGHMVPTLEDVARITGLRVDGQAVTGTTYKSYQEPVERMLDLEVRGDRSSLVGRTTLQASLGVANEHHRTGEGQAEYLARLTEDARAVLAEEEGETADRDLRRFLILVIGKLILGTRGDPVGCRCLPLLEDLSSVGNYAWGAALLAHLFDSLGTSSRETGVAGFFPLLQVWVYYRLPSLGRGVARRRSAVPLLQRWRFCHDERSLWRQVMLIRDSLDTIPFGHVQWTPYVEENDATQPWVEQGRPYFDWDIWLHCFNTVVPLHHRLVARTLGLHQAVRAWERPGRSFRRIQQVTDWTVRVREKLEDWERRGKEVVSEATSDEDYFRAYARTYGAQVYRGTRRPLDPKGRIASLEGVLHSTIQQRDDLQAVVDQLLDRAQQMVGGASSSREDPGRSVLEGQLASAVTRAEDALVRLQERVKQTNLLEASRKAGALVVAAHLPCAPGRLCVMADLEAGQAAVCDGRSSAELRPDLDVCAKQGGWQAGRRWTRAVRSRGQCWCPDGFGHVVLCGWRRRAPAQGSWRPLALGSPAELAGDGAAVDVCLREEGAGPGQGGAAPRAGRLEPWAASAHVC